MTENEAAEKILQAADIIAKKRIEQLGLNKIIICQITNTANKMRGEYGVTINNITFKAYSIIDTYELNDKVYVLVPNGDFKETKIIIGYQSGNKTMNIIQTINNVVKKYYASVMNKILICEITDITNRQDGKYEVENNSSTFYAYSEVKTYENKDTVYVLIPNVGMADTPLIIGRKR